MARTVLHRSAHAPSVADWLDASGRHQPLSERTVLELSRRIRCWQEHPDGPEQAPAHVRRRALSARNQLVRHNLKLISHTWAKHRSSLPAEDESTADALQEAALCLVRAAEKFDPTRGYRFSTYASFWVRRGFSTHERKGKRMIRMPHDKAALVLRAFRLAAELQATTGQLPDLGTVAARCGARGESVPVAELQALISLWWNTVTTELDCSSGEDDGPGLSRLERIAGTSQPNLEGLDRPADAGDEHRALLPRLLELLTPQERELLSYRYLQETPLSHRQIQQRMGLSKAEQLAMEAAALEQLRGAARKTALDWSDN
jgi:RNA polymerase sigma factor (sigma-70 family)